MSASSEQELARVGWQLAAREYIALLEAELFETVPHAASCGWKSVRHRRGSQLRERLGLPSIAAVGMPAEEPREDPCVFCKGTGRQGWPIHPPTVKDSLSVAPDHTEDPRAMVEPAPAPARWRCEGCGENPVKGTPWIIPFSPDPMMVHGENGYYCGPVVPVGEAGS